MTPLLNTQIIEQKFKYKIVEMYTKIVDIAIYIQLEMWYHIGANQTTVTHGGATVCTK